MLESEIYIHNSFRNANVNEIKEKEGMKNQFFPITIIQT